MGRRTLISRSSETEQYPPTPALSSLGDRCLRQWSNMTSSAINSPEQCAAARFLIASDLRPGHPAWPAALAQMEDIRQGCARILGFYPCIALQTIEQLVLEPGCETFVVPAALAFSFL